MHRFLISAAHKSSGKTTLSIGLAAALRQRGLSVQPFKKGPDYIDPLWLTCAAGRGCRNLDFFLSSHDQIRQQFACGENADVCLIEGNKGLYDGLDLDGANSNAALARLLDLPVLLVIDARGMTRGIAPLILGYQAFERDIRIAGVILNRLGGSRHEAKLRAVIEHYTDVPVLGAVHEEAQLALVERHLGLMPANEAAHAETLIAGIAARITAQIDLDRLLDITATATRLPVLQPHPACSATPLRVAIAQDAAFGFYYHDDLEALVDAGAKLIPFDTLKDASLPDCDALFIGGGFPESFLDELSGNTGMRASIRQAIEDGLPTYAECGGLMYLAKSITWRDTTRSMVGVIDGDILMHPKPMGRGYVILDPTPAHPWRAPAANPTKRIHAHEFHYSELRGLPPDTRYAYTVKRGFGIDGQHDGIVHHNLLASYTHLRATTGCDWPQRFIQFARACQREPSAR
jgi:cobyrinic acid a,c-diamide synthase